MFVERLNKEDFLNLYKLMIKKNNKDTEIIVVDNNGYKRFFNENLINGIKEKLTNDVMIINEDRFITNANVKFNSSDDHKKRDYFAYCFFCVKLDSKKQKAALKNDFILLNDFLILWEKEENSHIEADVLHDYMLKKFGDEYISALRLFMKNETQERINLKKVNEKELTEEN
ncbi:MAG: hypothetical protein E7359_01370 [Clostridiales bacterium]|nr:hypothetical protein [Clostridiales bacterium]